MTNSELKSKVMTPGNRLAPAWETAGPPSYRRGSS
jgi:hypothetical protein